MSRRAPAAHLFAGEEIVHSRRKRRGRVNPLVVGSNPTGPISTFHAEPRPDLLSQGHPSPGTVCRTIPLYDGGDDHMVALLRAVNVGGTGKMPMPTLVKMCEAAGFDAVRTYIASGNVMFNSRLKERRIKGLLEERLASYAGKSVSVLVRSADEMRTVLAANPFQAEPGNRTVAIFLDTAPPAHALEEVRGTRSERLALGTREIYVAYPDGMAGSKLVIPAAKTGTARNMNTIAKLAAMTSES